MQNNITTLSRL